LKDGVSQSKPEVGKTSMDTQRPVGQRPAGARASLVSRLNLHPRLASLSTLRLPAYRYLVLSAALNSMANESRLMAQAWLLLALTNSDGWVGLVAGLPALLAAATAPLGGVFADRGERRRMLMLAGAGTGGFRVKKMFDFQKFDFF
jgi:MFS family permease